MVYIYTPCAWRQQPVEDCSHLLSIFYQVASSCTLRIRMKFHASRRVGKTKNDYRPRLLHLVSPDPPSLSKSSKTLGPTPSDTVSGYIYMDGGLSRSALSF